MTDFIEEMDKAFTLLNKMHQAAVSGVIKHEEKDAFARVVKDNAAEVLQKEIDRMYPKQAPAPAEPAPAPVTEKPADKPLAKPETTTG
jgi:hypothetical protein